MGQKHDQEERWLGKRQLKKKGKETLRDVKQWEDNDGEKFEKFDLVNDENATNQCLGQSNEGISFLQPKHNKQTKVCCCILGNVFKL